MHKLICTNCGKEIIRREPQRYKNIFCCKFCESEFRKGKLTREPKKNEIILLDNYAVINIKNNKLGLVKCLIDKEDVDIVKDYFWSVRIDPRHPECSIYVETHKNKKRHREILEDVDKKYATKSVVSELQTQIHAMADKVDKIYNILIDRQ